MGLSNLGDLTLAGVWYVVLDDATSVRSILSRHQCQHHGLPMGSTVQVNLAMRYGDIVLGSEKSVEISAFLSYLHSSEKLKSAQYVCRIIQYIVYAA